MQLYQFQISHFRSILDSGLINVDPQRNVLLGRNESGKTNLLLALHSLNPPDGLKALSYVRDFPRQCNLSDFDENLTVVRSLWRFDEQERAHLAKLFPRAAEVSEIQLKRPYKAVRQLAFLNLPVLQVDQDAMQRHSKSFERSIKNQLKDASELLNDKVGRALNIFSHEVITGMQEPQEWAQRILKMLGVFRKTMENLKFELSDHAQNQLQSVEEHASALAADEAQYKRACEWVLGSLPVFVYLDEYPRLRGHQNLKNFLLRMEKAQMTVADEHFARLCKVSELNPKELAAALTTDHRHRQLLSNRASAIISKKLQRLWSNRQLKVRFHLDAEHFDTLVSDASDEYDMEVNLDERSQGFQWFFSFYIAFAADTGNDKNVIILLDEPGMALHPLAQRDLLKHFDDFSNPILYTTHSPFMIPEQNLEQVRTINMNAQHQSQVSNQPQGDEQTLFPLRAALAYQQLSSHRQNPERPSLWVESLREFWYLSVLQQQLGGAAAEVEILPIGLTQDIAALLRLYPQLFNNQRILISGKNPLPTAPELPGILRLSDFSSAEHPVHSIEDLFTPYWYDTLVKLAYAAQLGENPQLNLPALPYAQGIVAAYSAAFQQRSLRFNPQTPAQYYLSHAQHSQLYLDEAARGRFGKMFGSF